MEMRLNFSRFTILRSPGGGGGCQLPLESAGSLATISAPVSPSKAAAAHCGGGGGSARRTPVPSLDGLGSATSGSPKIRHAGANGKQSAAATKKKHSLTASLSNMMSQLDVRTGTAPAVPGLAGTGSVPEDDAMSFRSDDSGDSECFVVINQVLTERDSVNEKK